MPDRLAPLLAATDLAAAMFGMFAAQNRLYTSSPPPHTEAGGRRKRTHTSCRFSVPPRFKPLQAVRSALDHFGAFSRTEHACIRVRAGRGWHAG
jgi:hypothetical protein